MTEMMFPHNLFYDLGTEGQNPQTEDFMATLHYVLRSVASDRDTEIVLMRYIDNKTFDEIGTSYNLSRQRVQIIVQSTLDKLKGAYTDMLKKGLAKYYDDLLINRVSTIVPRIDEEERKQIRTDAYTEGYRIGFEDGATDRRSNSTDRPIELIEIEPLNISVRSRNALVRNGIRTLGDLVNRGDECIDFPSFGKNSFIEMANLLSSYGVSVVYTFPRACKKYEWREPNE